MLSRKQFDKLLKKIPKAEIHIHSEGIISKKTASRLLSRKDPAYRKSGQIDKLFSYDNLPDFIKTFLAIQNSFEDLDDFEALFNDVALYLKSMGIVYTEMFFSPSLFVKNGWNFSQMMDVFLKKIKKIRKKYRIEIKIIIDVSRTFGLENSMRNLEAVLRYKNRNIIGIGLGGDELKGPAKDFEPVFKKAEEKGLRRVTHAGEDDVSKSIWDALQLLNAERIGHGIAAMNDEKLMDYLRDHKIPLEICPTSNIFTRKYVSRIEDHPIRKFFDHGILTTVNTDDPTFFNVNLIDEYWKLYTSLHFTLDEIKELIINSFKASFLTKKKKKNYIRKVKKAWNKAVS